MFWEMREARRQAPVQAPERAPNEVRDRPVAADARLRWQPPEIAVPGVAIRESKTTGDVGVREQRFLLVENVVGRWVSSEQHQRHQEERHQRDERVRIVVAHVRHHRACYPLRRRADAPKDCALHGHS